jgi:hypothetical protein
MLKRRFARISGPLFALCLFSLSFLVQSCLLNTSNSFTADSHCDDDIEDIRQLQATLSPHGCFTAACHGDWGNYDSEDDYVAEGLLVKGVSGSSLLYTKLHGAGGGGDMPKGFYQDVSTACLGKIAAYINSL